jgi:hypothetical protein
MHKNAPSLSTVLKTTVEKKEAVKIQMFIL